MKIFRNIIDTWNLIEKYDLSYERIDDRQIAIPDAEYERLLASVVNKRYINNLLASNGYFASHAC